MASNLSPFYDSRLYRLPVTFTADHPLHTQCARSSVNHSKLAKHPSFKCLKGATQNIKNQFIVWQFGSSFLLSHVKPMERCTVVLLLYSQYGGTWAWKRNRLEGAILIRLNLIKLIKNNKIMQFTCIYKWHKTYEKYKKESYNKII